MTKFKDIQSHENGNISLLFALKSLCATICVGVVIDYANMTKAKQNLQNAVDASALSGASVAESLNSKDRLETVYATFSANDAEESKIIENGYPSVSFDDANALVTVDAEARVNSIFANLFKKDHSLVHAKAVVEYSTYNAESIAVAFVLDVSGSMGERVSGDEKVKIEALKEATEVLFTSIEEPIAKNGPVGDRLRSSLSSYNVSLVPQWTTPMVSEYGNTKQKGKTKKTIKKLSAYGNTNSTAGLEDALDKLKGERAAGPTTQLYMLLMTDGVNTLPGADEKSKTICDRAKALEVNIYTVAFDAPIEGKNLLLNCASRDDGDDKNDSACAGTNPGSDCKALKENHYFDAANQDNLIKAFKEIGQNIGEKSVVIKS